MAEPAKTETPKPEIPDGELKFKDGPLTPAELRTFGILPPEVEKTQERVTQEREKEQPRPVALNPRVTVPVTGSTD